MSSGRNGPRYQANTRYGYTCGTTTRLDNGEERFQWQKPPNEFDAIYNVKLGTQVRDLHFGTSTRADWETTMKNKRDSFNPNAGPGSYKRDKEFLISSESRNKEAPRFQDAPRQGMANMNGTPGPIYNVEKKYKRGVEKSIGIGFGRSKRKNLHLTSAADAMYAPKVEVPNFAVAFGEGDRFKYEAKYSLTDGTPGPIYEVHDAKIFDTIRTKAPNTVWGKGRGSRFKTDSVWGY
ncbi:hypothetical protein TeGR_g4847 [Tetraparma gracilis]|uniref:Uncharacterized protein n=1 Tax=Tetraparma gracilis TaxID=2962635 RepID=A0ABQ6MIP1_9STRA|nr:hypothetical protein TeGR_g4847 [Tetraparma gracilis]